MLDDDDDDDDGDDGDDDDDDCVHISTYVQVWLRIPCKLENETA